MLHIILEKFKNSALTCTPESTSVLAFDQSIRRQWSLDRCVASVVNMCHVDTLLQQIQDAYMSVSVAQESPESTS